MKINFVGNFQTNYVGEVGDATHLVRELRDFGHTVQQVPQDIWKAYVDGERNQDWLSYMPIKADINIILKWHHFNDKKYISELKRISEAPVFYWVWDYMWDQGIPQWHIEMASEADLYLGNDVKHPAYRDLPIKAYYFPFDVADKQIDLVGVTNKIHNVSFFGSWIGQGDRQVWLREINKEFPITVFSWNYQDWPEEFKEVAPAVYGSEFATQVALSKIILGFSVSPTTWGYWSNRTGKILSLGGFLLYQYAPGMELFLRDGAEYFSTIDEAKEKIAFYLEHEDERDEIALKGEQIGREHFTSDKRIKELTILIERFLKTKGEGWIV